MKESTGNLLVVVVALAYLVFMPFIWIWGANQLFALSIEYSLVNWFAAVALSTFFAQPTKMSMKK